MCLAGNFISTSSCYLQGDIAKWVPAVSDWNLVLAQIGFSISCRELSLRLVLRIQEFAPVIRATHVVFDLTHGILMLASDRTREPREVEV